MLLSAIKIFASITNCAGINCLRLIQFVSVCTNPYNLRAFETVPVKAKKHPCYTKTT